MEKIYTLFRKKYNGKVERVDFKDKRNGWIYPFAYVRINNQDIDIRKYDSLYYKDLISRPCCYECRFSSLNRTGDLSIGDLWGAGVRRRKYDMPAPE